MASRKCWEFNGPGSNPLPQKWIGTLAFSLLTGTILRHVLRDYSKGLWQEWIPVSTAVSKPLIELSSHDSLFLIPSSVLSGSPVPQISSLHQSSYLRFAFWGNPNDLMQCLPITATTSTTTTTTTTTSSSFTTTTTTTTYYHHHHHHLQSTDYSFFPPFCPYWEYMWCSFRNGWIGIRVPQKWLNQSVAKKVLHIYLPLIQFSFA